MSKQTNPARPQTLGTFLRAHRERLSPVTLGLVPATRRRTPGLRREEVAQLCGVSTTWYTWLEQGRPVSASAAVLSKIAKALQLSRAERLYLFEVAGSIDPENVEAEPSAVPAELKTLIGLLPVPAYVLDGQWNAVIWNRAASKLFRAWLVDTEDRNLLRFIFLVAAARDLIVDWNDRARRVVAEFRSDAGRRLGEPPTLDLIHDLQMGSRFFAKWWSEQDVKQREGGTRKFRSAGGTVATYRQVAMILSGHGDLKFITLVPEPRQTSTEKTASKGKISHRRSA